MPTINATIKNLDNQRNEKLVLGKLEDASALGVAKEALSHYQRMKALGDIPRGYLLPGETEE